MITLDKITKKIGTCVLFGDVSVTFNRGNRYGLTGPNGAGKSTLLKIMMGLDHATSGLVSLPKKVGFLKQNIEAFKKMRVSDVVVMGNERLWSAFVERESLYEKEMTDAIGMRLGDLEEIIADEDGYSAESNAAILLIGMGIEARYHEEIMETLPTDLQFRVLLCQALFGNPDALLLDEPTNHLDLESIGWLEEFLYQYTGTLVVVSHDRHFLNSVTTHIADIDYDTIIIYPGNYDQMLVAKTAAYEKTQQEIKSKGKKIAQLREFVSKFGSGTRASQVQSRIREIKRLESPELKKSNIQRPYICFPRPVKSSGEVVFKIQKVCKQFGAKEVIRNFTSEVLRGDKIAVIGSNGIGKTTLLRLLAKHLLPDRGGVVDGYQVDIGYFPQNHEDFIDKSERIQAFDWLKRFCAKAYDQDVRDALGKMLFGGDDAFKEVARLSGGETARLIFATFLLRDHNTLILDEPNNHLDLEAVSALGSGLSAFQGTVIVATHDRDLINDFATKIFSLEKDGIHVFDGNLDAYLSMKA